MLSDVASPVSLYARLAKGEPEAFLLESTEGGGRLARYSFMGVSPALRVQFACDATTGACTAEITDATGSRREATDDPMAFLQALLPIAPTQAGDEVPFRGGWVGYLGYEATRLFERIPQQLDKPGHNTPFTVPLGRFALYQHVVMVDHLLRRIQVVSMPGANATEAEALKQRVEAALAAPSAIRPLPWAPVQPDDVWKSVQSPTTEAQYCEAVAQAKQAIVAGEVFQIVVATRYSTPVQTDPLDAYRLLQALNPSPYAYYLKYPDFAYFGASPERMVAVDANRQVSLRALAGTRHRGETDDEDARLATELLADAKELAEHRMLVDLGRNDLGRICKVGTVTTGPIGQIVRYSHVMHLATDVNGELAADKTAYDALRSCFPRGTLSGAPKIRAMQLLSTLEPEHRGIYSGAVGYIDARGSMDMAIAIRSALVQDGVAHVHAGAGVVYDSVPQSEYQETRNKASGPLTAIAMANGTVYV